MPALDTYTSLLVVESGGSELRAEISRLLVRGRVTDGVDLPDSAELDFTDDRGEVAAHFAIGTEIKVRVAQNGPDGNSALFAGEVTSLEREDIAGSLHTRVRALDGAARLMHGTRVAAYVDSTVADVVRKVAQGAGLSIGTLEASGGALPHIAQDNVSDWVFLSRLARMTGSTFTVTGKRLDFGPPTAAREAPAATTARADPVVIQHGANAQYVRAVVTAAEQVATVSVRGWDVAAKQPVVSHADAKTRSAQLGAVTPAALAKKVGSREFLETTGEGRAASQDKLAASLADRLAGGFAEVEAVVLGNPAIRCGVAVTLTGFGAPFDGRYTVSETVHDFSSESGYATTATVSNVSDRSLFGVVTAGALTADASLGGVVSALVTDNLDPDEAGRVKLKFPFASDDYESGWARTAHVGAGPKRGMVYLPEIGDEVLVAFDHGFFDRPVVLRRSLQRGRPAGRRVGRARRFPRSHPAPHHLANGNAHRVRRGRLVRERAADDERWRAADHGSAGRREGRGDPLRGARFGHREAGCLDQDRHRQSHHHRQQGVDRGQGLAGAEGAAAEDGRHGEGRAVRGPGDGEGGCHGRGLRRRPAHRQGRNRKDQLRIVMSKEFVGRGWSFPVETDRSGRIKLTRDDREIEDSIRLILATSPGERPMRPEFGCAVHEYVFAPADASTAGAIGDAVRTSLRFWEPRIELDDVIVEFDGADQGRLLIDIRYCIRGDNDPRNLVFPFYVIPRDEGAE